MTRSPGRRSLPQLTLSRPPLALAAIAAAAASRARCLRPSAAAARPKPAARSSCCAVCCQSAAAGCERAGSSGSASEGGVVQRGGLWLLAMLDGAADGLELGSRLELSLRCAAAPSTLPLPPARPASMLVQARLTFRQGRVEQGRSRPVGPCKRPIMAAAVLAPCAPRWRRAATTRRNAVRRSLLLLPGPCALDAAVHPQQHCGR